MAQPAHYERQHSFGSYAAAHPTSPPPGSYIDDELNAIRTSLNQALDNLAILQRDDTALANATVSIDQLDDTVLALVGDKFNVKGPWATDTSYDVSDLYAYNGQAYLVMVAHVSTAVATDVAAGKVIGPIFDPARSDRALVVPTGEAGLTLPSAPARINKYMGFDNAGNPVALWPSDVASITDPEFGAVGDNVTVNTTAIQSCLNSGAIGVYIPKGQFKCGTLVMPNIKNFNLFGNGWQSQLIQLAGGSLITWGTSSIYYMQGVIRDIYINGAAGTNHIIDMTGVGGVDIRDVYIKDLPIGYDGVRVNGTAATQTHDIAVNGLKVYSNTAGNAGISFGGLTADSRIHDFLMNGNNICNYGILLENGSVATEIKDCHPYNLAQYVMKATGSSGLQVNGCTLDRAINGLVYLDNCGHGNWCNNHFEATPSGKSSVTMVNACKTQTFLQSRFGSQAGVVSMIVSDNTCTGIRAVWVDPGTYSDWSAPFNLQGANSSAIGILGYSPMGERWSFAAIGAAAQAQGTTQYLGVNGLQATFGATSYVVPYDGKIIDALVGVDTTPAAGQTRTYQVYKNGAAIGSALTVNNGGFGGTITLNLSVVAGDRIALQSVNSATSGSGTPRCVIRFEG